MPRKTNPKRQIAPDVAPETRLVWQARARYVGHPHHKRDPGDFDLIPPSQPHAKKTLCDETDVRARATAQQLLQTGLCRGLVSESRTHAGLPKYVWAIDNKGQVFESQGDHQGDYHGYPLLEDDAFREVVLAAWRERESCGLPTCEVCP